MPFKSEKQRKWMWANDPEMAARWEQEEKARRRSRAQSKKSKKRRGRRRVIKPA